MSVLRYEGENSITFCLSNMLFGSLLMRMTAFMFLQYPLKIATVFIPFWVSFLLMFCRGAQTSFVFHKDLPRGWRAFLALVYVWGLISMIFTVAVMIDLSVNGLCMDMDCFVPSNSPRYWMLNLMLFA